MSGAIQVARFLPDDLLRVTLAVRAGALDQRKAISRYDYDVGQTGQGLPQATVMSIAQTPDGYLWLGAPVGPARFYVAQFKLIEEETAALFRDAYKEVAL